EILSVTRRYLDRHRCGLVADYQNVLRLDHRHPVLHDNLALGFDLIAGMEAIEPLLAGRDLQHSATGPVLQPKNVVLGEMKGGSVYDAADHDGLAGITGRVISWVAAAEFLQRNAPFGARE